MSNWYNLTAAEVLHRLASDPEQGLDENEVIKRQASYGKNELIEKGRKSIWAILWEQLTATLVVVLIVAAVITAALGDINDTLAIFAIIVLNAALGTFQEFKAEKAMAELRRLAAPNVKVRRAGSVHELSARELVPGDIVILEEGALVPADCRLTESANLRINEAALTGESLPVDKQVSVCSGDHIPLGDRSNMIYLGTVVSYGRATAVVTETGMHTELGNIASMLQGVRREQTPLQRRLDRLGHRLVFAIVLLSALLLIIGLLSGESLSVMFMIAVSMAVAAIPEALPAVVTITLALGAQRMLKRQALIRKLPAVETLGSITVICSDKTGTLTENRMTVTALEVAGKKFDSLDNEAAINSLNNDGVRLLLAGGALSSDALLQEQDEKLQSIGDATESAMVLVSARAGLRKPELEQLLPRVGELPFDSDRKRMTTIHRITADTRSVVAVPAHQPFIAFTKGAVDSLMSISNQIWEEGRIVPLNDNWRARISEAHDRMTNQGLRVLGVACRPLASEQQSDIEREMIFIGMVGMIDPARPEVKQAVETCRAAGIRPIMITGDHPHTARYIAEDLMIHEHGRVITGRELDKMSVDELIAIVDDISVYARVSPAHKLKIIEALQQRGQIVAMTGDGVNDAPALKRADIGLAMGITGTDVAKEAADLVLLNDNFATIVAAVEEGRVIYDNIRKYIKNTLTGNAGAISLMLFAPVISLPLPLLPLQILWMNLVTDGLPSLALGLEPAEHDTMQRPPKRPDESLLDKAIGWHAVITGIVIGLVLLVLGYSYWQSGNPAWQTMVLTTLIFSRLGHMLATRVERTSVFTAGLFSNRTLIGAIALTVLLQLAIVYEPYLQGFFKTVALSALDLAISAAVSIAVFLAIELEKYLLRRFNSSKQAVRVFYTREAEKW